MRKIIQYFKHFFSYYTIIFILVICSNFDIGSFLLSDVLYTVICLTALIQTNESKRINTNFYYLLYFVITALLSFGLYGKIYGLLSDCRYIFGILVCSILFFSYGNNKYWRKVADGYCHACVFFSLVVVVQFIFFYVFKISIDLSFGEYSREMNIAGEYDPFSDLYYRTGGMFKEPSWYAAFVSPCLFITTHKKSYKELFIILIGVLMSTSGLGLAVLAIYFVFIVFSQRKMTGLFIALVLVVAYNFIPVVFQRLSGGSIAEDGSFVTRVLEPFQIILHIPEVSLIGISPSWNYDNSGEVLFFANTLAFIYIHFGIIGLCVFIKYVYFKKFVALTVAILAIISIEGLYGRIDFWMMLLACKIYSSQMFEEKRFRTPKIGANEVV